MSKKKTVVAEVKETVAAEVKETVAAEVKETKKVTPPTVKAKKNSMPNLSDDIKALETEKETKTKKVIVAGESKIKKITTKYNVTINGEVKLENGSKVAMAVVLLRHAMEKGMTQVELNASKLVATFPLLRDYPKDSTQESIVEDLGKDKRRYATKADKHIILNELTYVVCNQWYPANAEKLIIAFTTSFPEILVTEV